MFLVLASTKGLARHEAPTGPSSPSVKAAGAPRATGGQRGQGSFPQAAPVRLIAEDYKDLLTWGQMLKGRGIAHLGVVGSSSSKSGRQRLQSGWSPVRTRLLT